MKVWASKKIISQVRKLFCCSLDICFKRCVMCFNSVFSLFIGVHHRSKNIEEAVWATHTLMQYRLFLNVQISLRPTFLMHSPVYDITTGICHFYRQKMHWLPSYHLRDSAWIRITWFRAKNFCFPICIMGLKRYQHLVLKNNIIKF